MGQKKAKCLFVEHAPRSFSLYPGRDLNPHDRNDHGILSPACLPIPPPGPVISLSTGPKHPASACGLAPVVPLKQKNSPEGLQGSLGLSERRDSNPRPRPWQGRALPAELLSQCFLQLALLYHTSREAMLAKGRQN